jgi:hypothetical protein
MVGPWGHHRDSGHQAATLVGPAFPVPMDRQEHPQPQVGQAHLWPLLERRRYVLLVAEQQGLNLRDRQRDRALAEQVSGSA